jgi:hypothetical protein
MTISFFDLFELEGYGLVKVVYILMFISSIAMALYSIITKKCKAIVMVAMIMLPLVMMVVHVVAVTNNTPQYFYDSGMAVWLIPFVFSMPNIGISIVKGVYKSGVKSLENSLEVLKK